MIRAALGKIDHARDGSCCLGWIAATAWTRFASKEERDEHFEALRLEDRRREREAEWYRRAASSFSERAFERRLRDA
jgi:hypothetical protein